VVRGNGTSAAATSSTTATNPQTKGRANCPGLFYGHKPID
jgi:hypothetical protein